jgi:hypothetical protein
LQHLQLIQLSLLLLQLLLEIVDELYLLLMQE